MDFLPDFADHAPFVWGAYAVSFAVLAALAIGLILRAQASRRRLAEIQRAVGDLKASVRDPS